MSQPANPFQFRGPETIQRGSHMVTTGVDLETKYKYLNVDTRFSSDFGVGDLASYTVMLPERLTNIRSMTVVDAEVFVCWFNVSAAKANNSFRITDVSSGVHTVVVVPDGQYDAAGLAVAVGAGLPAGVTFSVDSVGRSRFDSVGGGPFYVEFYTDSVGGYDKRDPKFKLGWMMGFRSVAYPIGGGGSLISEAVMNLNGPRYLYLVVDDFQNGRGDSFVSVLSTSLMNKQILARIAVSAVDHPFGSIVSANLENGLLVSDTRRYDGGGGGVGGRRGVDIQQLRIQLVDETGRVVGLNGDDLSFCLKLEC